MEISAVTNKFQADVEGAEIEMEEAEYKPFLPSRTGNWLGYSEENPYTPPAWKSKTVATCLDRNYWLRHQAIGIKPPDDLLDALLFIL